jgi:hypothetical protein
MDKSKKKIANEEENKESGVGEKLGNIAKYTGLGVLTFVVVPFLYIVFVLVVIAILGFIFDF